MPARALPLFHLGQYNSCTPPEPGPNIPVRRAVTPKRPRGTAAKMGWVGGPTRQKPEATDTLFPPRQTPPIFCL